MPSAERLARLENADVLAADGGRLRSLLSDEAVDTHPYRDPERLAVTYEDHGTVAGVADAFGIENSTASRWLRAYGLHEPTQSDPRKLEEMRPEELGLTPLGDRPEGGESA